MTAPASPHKIIAFDGDVMAYIAASAAQTPFIEDGNATLHANVAEGEAIMQNLITRLTYDLVGKDMESIKRVVYLSDPGANWRSLVDPTYKKNRADVMRPLLLTHLKEYLRTAYDAQHIDTLEADDALGILSTHYPHGHVLIVGRDKDFKQIPGYQHQIGKPGIAEITTVDADRFFYCQVLAGDRIDGFPGCPGIGMTRAERIVDKPVKLVPADGIITRGPRRGTKITKWNTEPTADIWESIVSHYEKEGQGEADAIRNARLARILRREDYRNGQVRLWLPGR